LILTNWTECLQVEPRDVQKQEEPKPAELAPGTKHPWRGYFLVAGATFCWGAAATLGKAIFAERLFAGRPAISPLVITQTRTTFAVLILLAWLLIKHGRPFFRITKRDLVLCALIGTLGIAGSNYFYYVAIQKTTVPMAIILQYTAPIWVLLYMVTRGLQRPTVTRISAVFLGLIGTSLVVELFRSGVRLNGEGVIAAQVAAFSFAFYIVAGQGLVSRNHQLKVMTYALLSAAVMWLVVDPPWRLLAQNFSAGQWLFLFLFSCFSYLLPYILYFSGLKYLDPTGAVVTSCLEPVFATLLSVTFLHEPIHGGQLLGFAAVLAATIIVQRGK
jgi:drug/metabolite transporter (DMT)-like permease